MLQTGNHMKLTLEPELRERTREFYGGICEYRKRDSPRPDMDLYEFNGGFVLGIFFADDAETLPEPAYVKAAWLELKVDDVHGISSATGGIRDQRAALRGSHPHVFSSAGRAGISPGAASNWPTGARPVAGRPCSAPL